MNSIMTGKRRILGVALVLAAAATIAGLLAYRMLRAPAPLTQDEAPALTADIAVKNARRPDFELHDLEGRVRSVSEWDGKVLVVNFWATWCPPCRKEIPAFVQLQEQYGAQGLQFVGIAVDQRDAVADYADSTGINYPILVGEHDAIEVGKKYGNRFGALPFTVVVDRQGRMVFTKRGELKRKRAEEIISQLL